MSPCNRTHAMYSLLQTRHGFGRTASVGVVFKIPSQYIYKGIEIWAVLQFILSECIWWYYLIVLAWYNEGLPFMTCCCKYVRGYLWLSRDKLFLKFGTLVERTLKGLLKTWIMGKYIKIILPLLSKNWKIFLHPSNIYFDW